MQVSRTAVDNLSGFAGARHMSIEGYVSRTAGNLRFGSGYVVRDDGRSASAGAGRVVVNATFDRSGRLRVDKIQAVKVFPGQSTQGGRTELTPGAAPDPAGSNVPAGNSGGGPAGTGPPGPPPGWRSSGPGRCCAGCRQRRAGPRWRRSSRLGRRRSSRAGGRCCSRRGRFAARRRQALRRTTPPQSWTGDRSRVAGLRRPAGQFCVHNSVISLSEIRNSSPSCVVLRKIVYNRYSLRDAGGSPWPLVSR